MFSSVTRRGVGHVERVGPYPHIDLDTYLRARGPRIGATHTHYRVCSYP